MQKITSFGTKTTQSTVTDVLKVQHVEISTYSYVLSLNNRQVQSHVASCGGLLCDRLSVSESCNSNPKIGQAHNLLQSLVE